MEYERVLTGAVKFTLQVKLDDFYIAHGHADVFVSQHLHERRQADAETHHLCGEGVEWRSRCGFTRPVQPAARALSVKLWRSISAQ